MFSRLSLPRRRVSLCLVAAVLPVLAGVRTAAADDASPPVILQWFDGSYNSIENRMGDVFKAGYGMIYTPPPGRADSGNQSVGYDQYDRFDLGSAGNPTLYGTETGLKKAVVETHKAGLNYAVDLVLNHNGFSDLGTPGFYDAGGYPGMNITLPGAIDGDFHGVYDYGPDRERLAGLIDIDHSTNWQMIRSPVDPNDPRNIRPGTTPRYGRLANVADPNNARFYPDLNGPYISVFDPKTGEGDIRIYTFNTANPLAGDAVPENATGYLMRNTQWLVQSIGVDAFRLDAAKHLEGFALDYYDRSVYRQNTRRLLDGSQPNVFSWSEVYDGDKGYLQTFVRKDINPADPGRIGGDRDTMDFPLFFAMRGNLTGNGYNNDWRNVVGSSLDLNDDGKMNGSQGVKFVSSHDDYGPELSNTAHAYTLMTPGNAIVYYNAKEFGAGRDFPKDGRGDALGGAYGDTITKLVGIRNVYAQGDFRERYLSKESYAFERSKQSITLLSNRLDNTYDNQRIYTDFSYGEYLVELTGNAAKFGAPQVLQVTSDGWQQPNYVNASFLPNNGGDHGYLVYGLQAPQGSLSLGNVSQTLAGGTPSLNGSADANAYANATTRLSDLRVLTGNNFTVNLNTVAVNLLGSIRDRNADGDNALVKIDEGLDLNRNGHVDYITAGSTAYGFEEFSGNGSTHNPGYFSNDGNGSYSLNVDTAGLSEGYHYLTVRAFRHREDGGPGVYQDFKEVLYVDRLKPVSALDSFKAYNAGGGDTHYAGDYDLWVKSTDQTADNVHVFLNLPANLTDAQILAMVGSGSQASKIDRDVFKYNTAGLTNGNNVFTVVTYEITGNHNVQRFTGINPGDTRGAGLGDLNFDGQISTGDVTGTSYGFEHFLYARNSEFNPAADTNGDGLIDTRDLFQLETDLKNQNAPAGVRNDLRQVTLRRGNFNGEYGTDQYDIDTLYGRLGKTGDIFSEDLNVDGTVDQGDVDAMVRNILASEYGDFNLDLKIDANDLQILAANWLQGNKVYAQADATGDHWVNQADLDLLKTYWGFGIPAGQGESIESAAARIGFSAVPEPGALALLGFAGLLLRRRRNLTPNTFRKE